MIRVLELKSGHFEDFENASVLRRNSGLQPDLSRGLVACVVPGRLQACRTDQAKSLSYSARGALFLVRVAGA